MDTLESRYCKKCKSTLSVEKFYTYQMNECKDCTCKRVRKNRKQKREYYLQFDRNRNMDSHRVAARREYIQTEAGKAARRKATAKHKENYPNEYKAKNIFRYALRSGKIIKIANCQQCGNESQEAHHDDYNHPLDVRWLCIPCHKEWHKHNTAKNRLGDFEQ